MRCLQSHFTNAGQVITARQDSHVSKIVIGEAYKAHVATCSKIRSPDLDTVTVLVKLGDQLLGPVYQQIRILR